jgi:hypothetical protein
LSEEVVQAQAHRGLDLLKYASQLSDDELVESHLAEMIESLVDEKDEIASRLGGKVIGGSICSATGGTPNDEAIVILKGQRK